MDQLRVVALAVAFAVAATACQRENGGPSHRRAGGGVGPSAVEFAVDETILLTGVHFADGTVVEGEDAVWALVREWLDDAVVAFLAGLPEAERSAALDDLRDYTVIVKDDFAFPCTISPFEGVRDTGLCTGHTNRVGGIIKVALYRMARGDAVSAGAVPGSAMSAIEMAEWADNSYWLTEGSAFFWAELSADEPGLPALVFEFGNAT